MNFVTWGIRQPIAVIVLFTALVVAGILGYKSLGVSSFPDVDIPVINATVSYPGVAPSQMETEITRKVEDSIASISGIKSMRSTINEGTSTTSVEFELEVDSAEALDEVKDAVTRIRSTLPLDANEPVVEKVKMSGLPVLTYSVTSDNLNDMELSWFVDQTLARAITGVKGVGGVNRVGGVDREVLITLNTEKMQALNLSASDISRQLKATEVESSAGEARLGDKEQTMRAISTVKTAAEMASLEIPTSDGRRVKLSDIATIRDQAADPVQAALLNGKKVIGFQVSRAKSTSEVTVAEAVRQAVRNLQEEHPNIKMTEIVSTVDFVKLKFDDSVKMLLEGALFAVIVVYLFLRDWRATLIAAVALPLSIIPTFYGMHVMGHSLNTITLLALALVVGILVDDAIVEVENIERHLRMGKKPLEAAADAANEIGMAVVATTFALVAVFMPLAFMSGVVGKFFKQFGFAAVIAILFSLLVARILTPMMAAYIMRPHAEKPETTSTLGKYYLKTVKLCLEHRWLTMLAAGCFFVVSMLLVPLLGNDFVPAADNGYSTLSVELAPGTRLAETEKALEQARKIIAKDKDVESIFVSIGASSAGNFGQGASVGQARKASMTIRYVDKKLRPHRKQQKIERELLPQLAGIAGARLSFGSGAVGEKIKIILLSNDATRLSQVSESLVQDVRAIPGIGTVQSTASLFKPEVVIRPNTARAAELGVTTEAIGNALRLSSSGDFSNALAKLNLPERQLSVRVRLDDAARNNLDAIKRIQVPGKNGMVALETVAEISLGTGSAQIDRYNRNRSVTVQADLQGMTIGDVAKQIQASNTIKKLPPSVRQEADGDAKTNAELGSSFGKAMLIGVGCIFLVLILLFKDFLQPITILAALPLSVGGAFGLMLITGTTLSMPTMIGLVMLMGVATKNSILLVEYAIVQRRDFGMSRFDALMDACAKRSRPIIMTTIAMGAGMLPLALGYSADPSFRTPMAIAVLGGLITSTFLSLFVIPPVFTVMDDIGVFFKKLFIKKLD